MSIKTLGKESLIYGAGHVVTRLITFLLLPLYTHFFSPDEYGVISLAYAFIGFSLILYRHGMDTALMKYSVQLKSDNRISHISSIYLVQIISSVIFSTILYLIRNYVSEFVVGIDDPNLIVIICWILIFDNLWNHHILLLRTENKAFSFILFNIANVLITMILNIIFIVKLKLGVEGVLLANLFASGIIFVFSLPIMMQKISINNLQSKIIKKIFKFSLPFFPAGIFAMIMELSNRYIIDWFSGIYSVGLFSAGYKLGLLGLIIVMGFNMGWTPYFLKRIKSKDNPKLEFSIITSVFLGLLGFFILVVSLWSYEIIRFKIGSNYFIAENYWPAEKIVPVVLFGYFFFGSYVVQLPGVYAKEITIWIPIFRGIGALANVFLNIILVPKYGIIGSAWATVIAFFIMSLSIYIKLYNVYFINYNWLAICYPIFYVIFIFHPVEVFIYKFLILIFYWLGWYSLILREDERSKIKSLFK